LITTMVPPAVSEKQAADLHCALHLMPMLCGSSPLLWLQPNHESWILQEEEKQYFSERGGDAAHCVVPGVAGLNEVKLRAEETPAAATGRNEKKS
jgi:hypothetical protein